MKFVVLVEGQAGQGVRAMGLIEVLSEKDGATILGIDALYKGTDIGAPLGLARYIHRPSNLLVNLVYYDDQYQQDFANIASAEQFNKLMAKITAPEPPS